MDKLMIPASTLQWVDRDMLKPNDYNPNKVSKQNLELLTQSIFTNGWTLPIVVRPDYTIIDGFHRWTVAGPDWKYVPPSETDRRTLYERLGGKVLVVIVDHKDKAGNFYSAWYALRSTLEGNFYNPETGSWEWGYNADEETIKEALTDFNDIVTQLLTSDGSIIKSLEKAAKEAPEPVMKAGKS